MEKIGIAKLTNDNYDSWKLEVEFLLVREGLWKYVSPGVKPEVAASGSNVAELAAWDEGDQRARATIGLLLTKSQHGHIRNTNSAKAVWDNLEKQHQKKTLTTKVHLLKRICDMEYHDGDNIEEHLMEFEDLFEKLANAGTKLDEDLQVVLVFRSLPGSFDALTTTLENRADDELTMHLVKGKIINEVHKRRDSSVVDSVVLKAEDKKKNSVCFFCEKPGHKKANCSLWLRQKKEEGDSSSAVSRHSEVRKVSKKLAKAKLATSRSEEFTFLARECVTNGCVVNSDVNVEPRNSAFVASECAAKDWIVDSGASSHMCANRKFFVSFNEPRMDTPKSVTVADGKHAAVKGVGLCQIFCIGGGGAETRILLSEVLFVPDLDMNLVSVGRLVQKGASVIFDKNGCRIANGDKIAAIAPSSKGLFHLQMVERASAVSGQCHTKNCIHEWHRKLGHRDTQAILDLERKALATGIKVRHCSVRYSCEPCLEGKMARRPFPKKVRRKSKAVLDLIHSDLCGPMKTATPGGRRYFLSLIDDYSRFTTLYILRKKSDTVDVIRDFVRLMKTQFGRPPKIIRSDQGGEYRSAELVKFLKQEGIQQQFTTAYTPQQNGVAERKNRSLVEMARCMIIDSGLHYRYWAEAVNTANHLQNMLPTKPVQQTPYEIWHGTKPDMSMIQIFGSEAYVHIPKEKRTKLQSKATKLTFVGYSQQHKAWRFIDLKTNEIVFSRDARFLPSSDREIPDAVDDEIFVVPPVKPSSNMEHEESDESDEDSEDERSQRSDDEEEFRGFEEESCDNLDIGFENPADRSVYEDANGSVVSRQDDELVSIQRHLQEEQFAVTPRRSGRSTKGIPPERYVADGKLARSQQCEPRSYQEAVSDPENGHWKAAMNDELKSLRECKAWDLTSLPPGSKTIGCRWIYKKKQDEQGKLVRYKARLVAQGFTQRYGLDYDEVFAPVAKQVTLRTLLTIAGRDEMQVRHVDVKTAYLNGDLKETIYMRVPPGLRVEKGQVCRLRKSLYGLKQSARVWNQKLNDVMKRLGFRQADADPCLYVRKTSGGTVYILVYVDDMLIATSRDEDYEGVVKALASEFQITTLGEVKHFLGIRVTRKNNAYCLDQKAYIDKLVAQFGLADAKGSRIPMDVGYLQQKEELESLPNNEKFQSLVGGLLYLSVNTRPDIAISTSILGRQVSKPTNADWTEAKRVLRYLKSTSYLKLELAVNRQELRGYADADWAGNVKDRKSNSGYLFQLGGGPISWCARKQSCVALSSTEAEYISLAESCRELLWLKKLLKDFGEPVQEPVQIFEDNQSCIKMLEQNAGLKRSKHVDTKYHFVKDLAENDNVNVTYCPSADMLADIFTKPLNRVKLEDIRERIGLRSLRDEEE